MYRGRLWTMRQYAGFGTAEESNRRYRYLLVARHHRTFRRVRFAHPDGHGFRSSAGGRRSGPRGRRHLLAGRHAAALRWHPPGRHHHVDDHQFDGGHSAELLRAGGAQPGRRPAQALRHHPERHSQGIHRARHLHLSAAARHAHHHRPVRLGRARTAGMEHHLHQRLSHSRSRLHRDSGSGLHAGQRHRLHRARRIEAGLEVDAFAPRLSFFFNAHNNFLEEIAKYPRRAAAVRDHHARPLRRAQSPLA